MLPTLHAEAGHIFEMVMFDCQERRHAHVRGNGRSGTKVWLEPQIEVASPGGYNAHEVRQMERIIKDNLAKMVAKWDEECARPDAEGTTR